VKSAYKGQTEAPSTNTLGEIESINNINLFAVSLMLFIPFNYNNSGNRNRARSPEQGAGAAVLVLGLGKVNNKP